MSKYTFELCDISDIAFRRGVQTYRIMTTGNKPELVGFLTNQYGVGYQIGSEYDWRVFNVKGHQVHPWNLHTRMGIERVKAEIQKMDIDTFTSSKSVIICATTKLGMTGFLNADNGYLYFSAYPKSIADEYFARLTKDHDVQDLKYYDINHPEMGAIRGTLDGDEVTHITITHP